MRELETGNQLFEATRVQLPQLPLSLDDLGLRA
jgi:hypothetical protein